MFKKLKDKLKGALGIFSKKVEEEAKEAEAKEPEEAKVEKTEAAPKPEKAKAKKGKPEKKIEKKKSKPEGAKERQENKKTEEAEATKEITSAGNIDKTIEKPASEEAGDKATKEEKANFKEPGTIEPVSEAKEQEVKPKEKKGFFRKFARAKEELKAEEQPEEKKGFFKKITEKVATVELSEEKFEELFWELEVALLENSVALEVVEKIKEGMRVLLTKQRVKRSEVSNTVLESLKKAIKELFQVETPDLLNEIKKSDKPYVIAFIGINGSGKTTTMAKIANMLMKNKLSVVFAAADTFRAASIEQLGEHADRLGVKMIRHDYQSDPAAVAFDAIEHAKSKKIDVVLVDTAGRLHSNKNLMEELSKLIRVNSPDMKIFVGESTTGNDCVEQAKQFDETVGIDSIVLTKADVDEKGGAAISISFVTGKPIIYIGTGQTYDDLKKFDSDLIMKSLF